MARSLEAYNRTRNKDKGKKKKSRIEEITDILGDMSPGQLSGLENFIAGERQGENIRGVVDPNAIAESAPGLGVRTGAPELTDFGAGSLGGARMEALPLREPPEDKPSRMSRLMGGLGRVGKGVGGLLIETLCLEKVEFLIKPWVVVVAGKGLQMRVPEEEPPQAFKVEKL